MKLPLLACFILVLSTGLVGQLGAAPPVKEEPTKLLKPESQKSTKQTSLDERYQAWVSTLPTAQQAWERVLQSELGSFYLPLHERAKVDGDSDAWDYVEDDPTLPRVLLIGDSISRGYTQAVREKLAGRANVHRAPANCGAARLGLKKIDVWLGDGDWDVIHFNFGIHDRTTPVAKYSQQLELLVRRLKKTGATLVWASTTPIPENPSKGVSDESIVALNVAAAKLMAEHGIAVDDLYSAIAPRTDKLRLPGSVHYDEEGYQFLGSCVAESLLSLPELQVTASKRL
jgi:GDSL-like Lipase/Acylhydrolase family